MQQRIRKRLAKIRDAGLFRQRRRIDSAQGVHPVIDGKACLSFCSNDYLGLANHPEINAAFKRGIDQYGSGSGSAHLISGHSQAHQQLEEQLADWLAREAVLLFSTGYMANLAVVSALMGRHDTIFQDRLNHASLLDAAKLSGARQLRYTHNNPASLEQRFTQMQPGEALVVSDGLFSMDGNRANLVTLANVADKHDAWLMIDDAHGLGTCGSQGRGSLDLAGMSNQQVPVLIGTLGKAFGTAGAFVAGNHDLIDLLINIAHPYIYTTAQPPALAVATSAALKRLREDEWRRERLQSHIHTLRSGAEQLGIQLMPSDSPIQPLNVGSSEQASAISKQLWQAGILVTAIRPPTVPEGSARLRITLSSAHSDKDIRQLLNALSKPPSS